MAAKEPSAKEMRDIIAILEALPEVRKKIERKARLIGLMATGDMSAQYLAYKYIVALIEYIDKLPCLSGRDKEVIKYFYL